jgi:hypothetical protein
VTNGLHRHRAGRRRTPARSAIARPHRHRERLHEDDRHRQAGPERVPDGRRPSRSRPSTPVNDDTDIFLANPNITAERPNVLIIVDKHRQLEPGLHQREERAGAGDQRPDGPVQRRPDDHERLEHQAHRLGHRGRLVRALPRAADDADQQGEAHYIIGNFDINADKGDNNMAGMALYEAYLYFSGSASRSGDDQSKPTSTAPPTRT